MYFCCKIASCQSELPFVFFLLQKTMDLLAKIRSIIEVIIDDEVKLKSFDYYAIVWLLLLLLWSFFGNWPINVKIATKDGAFEENAA